MQRGSNWPRLRRGQVIFVSRVPKITKRFYLFFFRDLFVWFVHLYSSFVYRITHMCEIWIQIKFSQINACGMSLNSLVGNDSSDLHIGAWVDWIVRSCDCRRWVVFLQDKSIFFLFFCSFFYSSSYWKFPVIFFDINGFAIYKTVLLTLDTRIDNIASYQILKRNRCCYFCDLSRRDVPYCLVSFLYGIPPFTLYIPLKSLIRNAL